MTAKYDLFELTLEGPCEGNPFIETTLEAQFWLNDRVLTVPGFYDGDGLYRLRFMPDAEGEWRYQTASNIQCLDGIAGTVEVGPAKPGSHGPVRVHDRYHFAYDDGTPFLPFGTTAYNWVNQPPDIVAQTWETLAAAPFNKVRMSPMPKHYFYNLNEPLLYPFEGGLLPGMEEAAAAIPMTNDGSKASGIYAFDFDRPNPAFWRYFDMVVAQMNEMSIECDFILFHPYDRWGFAHMSKEQNLRYIKYAVARYAAYPNIWWSMANEWDLFHDRSVADWEAYAAEVVKWDCVGHLRSIHNCVTLYDYGKEWVTHVSIQRVDYHTHVTLTDKWRERWQKPVVIDEVCYEGDIDSGFGNITGEELTRRFWETAVRGGYCTHGETYLHPDDVLWWAKGGKLYGSSPARIAFLRRIQEDAPGYWNAASGEWDLAWAFAGRLYPGNRKAGIPDSAEYMLCYFSFARPRFRVFQLPEDRSYHIDIIDTWDMTITPVAGKHSGKARVDLPAKTDIAVRFKEV